MKHTILRLITSCLLWFSVAGVAFAAQVQVQETRLWAAPDHTRVVFELSANAQYRIFNLNGPDRIVIDLADTKLAANPDQTGGLVKRIRHGTRSNGALRLVMDLRTHTGVSHFLLPPNDGYGHRLVVDLAEPEAESPELDPQPAVTAPDRSNSPRIIDDSLERQRDIIIAIDAGHGGDDHGAVGKRGTKEKEVVLSISRKLEDLINKERGLKAVLIRGGDYYVGLRKRMDLARKKNADLFISVHANSYPGRKAQGASVYILSTRGVTSEAARWLANKENASDLHGGVRIADKDNTLASVLLDLSQSASLEASIEVGGTILGELGKIGKLHKRSVQEAGFLVLKSPDIPSVLVETAFISNPTEERKLRSSAYQWKIANAILQGSKKYLRQKPPPGTRYAWMLKQNREYVVAAGDTLGGIAQKYGVSLKALRKINGVRGDRIRVGQRIQLPGRTG